MFLSVYILKLLQGNTLYRGVTVLLPGWVTWKLMWFVHANLTLGRLASVRTTDSHWGKMAQFVYCTDFYPNTISSILLQCKNKLQVHIKPAPTKQDPKQNIVYITVCALQNIIISIVCEIKKSNKVALATNKKKTVCNTIYNLWRQGYSQNQPCGEI